MSRSIRVNLPDMSVKLNDRSKYNDISNKLISLLLSTKLHSTDYAKQQCEILLGLSADKRRDHIQNIWGPIAASKSEALLAQLAVLDKAT